MFKFFAELSVRSIIEKDNTGHKKNFLPWDKIEKIALVVSKQESLNKSQLDKFVSDTKKFVEVFYVELSSKEATYADWHCFTKKDASFLKLPKNAVMEDLKKKKFDLVINTATENDLFATAVCGALPAVFKCGSSSKYNETGLIIERTDNAKLLDYLNETLKYLKMIRA